MSIYCIDIDGTICKTKNGDYKNAKPIKERIRFINNLWLKEHTIIYYTARGSETGKNWRVLTKRQLLDWGARYDKLVMGKPYADYYIDDHNLSIKQFFL